MRVVFKPAPVSVPAPLTTDRSKKIRKLGWLIVLYIVLLMVEGALRKWIVPKLSNPLLVVRDPVLILIYIMALRARVFPRNGFVISLGVIGFVSLALSLYMLLPYIASWQLWVMVLYGFRSNFFHLPLIFLIPKVFEHDDVKRIGWWILLGMIPLSMLMVAQFEAPAESLINTTAGGEGATQLETAGGKIRPPGFFSFITGPIFYSAMAAAFWVYGILSRGTYKLWLLIPSGIALALSVGVSGSRACVVAVLLVIGAMLVTLIIRPGAVNQFGRVLLIAIVGAFVIGRLPVFKEGVSVLSERFTSNAEAEESTVAKGMANRVFEGFSESLTNLNKFPPVGWGLGIGTNVGAHFLIGAPAFVLAENEWTRVLYESGPVVGLAFLLWRTVVTGWLGWLSIVALWKRGETLPILLYSAGFYVLLNGQFGQPTTLGFAVVLCGLCLAAMQGRQAKTDGTSDRLAKELKTAAPGPKRLPRSSPYAIRLHKPGADQNNGFTDR